jgi:hypothetical protein
LYDIVKNSSRGWLIVDISAGGILTLAKTAIFQANQGTRVAASRLGFLRLPIKGPNSVACSGNNLGAREKVA